MATSIPKIATSTIILLGNPPTLLMHFVWYTHMLKLHLKTNLHMAWDRKIQMSEYKRVSTTRLPTILPILSTT